MIEPDHSSHLSNPDNVFADGIGADLLFRDGLRAPFLYGASCHERSVASGFPANN